MQVPRVSLRVAAHLDRVQSKCYKSEMLDICVAPPGTLLDDKRQINAMPVHQDQPGQVIGVSTALGGLIKIPAVDKDRQRFAERGCAG